MQDLYTVNENTKTATSTSTYIEAGIHENLKLVEIKYDVTKNGNEFLAFYATNDNGDKVSNTEWPYTPRTPWEQMDENDKEKAISIIENQKAKVKQIVETFKPNFNITASSFKEFAEKTIQFLGDSYTDVKFRLKVVYDKRNYTTFAQSARYQFIEPMTVTKEDSQIRVLSNDKMERDGGRDKPSTETLPTALIDDGSDTAPAATTTSDSTEELPF